MAYAIAPAYHKSHVELGSREQGVRVKQEYKHMRSFKNVQKSKQQELISLFPEIRKLYAVEKTDTYKQNSLCVFDHWLSTEEAIKEIDKISSEKEQEHNKKLHLFCSALAKSTETYLIKLLGKNKEKIVFKEFTSETGLEKTLIPENYLVSDMFRFVLAFPKLNIIYFEGCDFTHHIFYKNEKDLNTIRDIATEHGLFLLK